MTDVITTTLAKIRAKSPRENGYRKLVKSLGGVCKYGKNTPITFRQIYESNGYDDTLWCLCTVDERFDGVLRHFACDCADDVRHLMTDKRSTDAIDVARRFADGLATKDELDAAWDAAWGAAREAALAAAQTDARDSAWDAAWAAAREAAREAAWSVARTDARGAAQAAARDSAWAAAQAAARDAAQDAARGSAWAGARAAARDAAQDAQMERLFKYCEKGERVK